MALLTQVFIFSWLFLSIYGHYVASNQPQETQSILDIINLSKLLQSAARLTYPITSGINNAVGKLVEPKNDQPPSNYYIYDSYEDDSASDQKAYINLIASGGNKLGADLQNLRRINGQDVNRRHSSTQRSYYYDNNYKTQLSQPYDYSSVGDDFLPHNSEELEPESNHSDKNEINSLSKIFEKIFSYKYVPELIPAAVPININDVDLVRRTPMHSLLEVKNSETNSEKTIPMSVTEVTNQLYIPTVTNLENKDNYAIPLTNLNVQEPKLETQPTSVNPPLTNSDNASGNVFPAFSGRQPSIIYVILNPGGINTGMDLSNPINLLSNEVLTLNEDGATNTLNGYSIIPIDAVSDVPNSNTPVSITPANANLDVNAPVSFIPADNMSKENEPLINVL